MHSIFHIPGYALAETLYQSEHTRVVRATESVSLRPVVIKMPAMRYPDPSIIVQYTHEHQILQELDGNGAPRAIGLVHIDHVPLLVFDDDGAETLVTHLRRGPLDMAHKLELSVALCMALENIHARHITHRDVNPANILVGPDGRTVQVIDFGESTRFLREKQEAVYGHVLVGTLPYLSPEQTGRMNRSVDHRTDLYALGATLYEIFTGEPPFVFSDALEMIHAHLAREPQSPDHVNPQIPRALGGIILKCLAKNPEDRYQSAYGVRADLATCLAAWQAHGTIHPFDLGFEDAAQDFHPSRKLYEREDTWREVAEAQRRASAGSVEFVIICGDEGSGKSAVLADFRQRLSETTPFVVGSAFHAHDTVTPYLAIAESCGQLFQRLLELPDDVVATWRQRLVAALPNDIAHAGSLIPHARLILGGNSEAPSLDEATHGLVMDRILKNVLGVFTERDGPLVIVLDDCQWADAYTESFFRKIAGDAEFHHLLFLLAYQQDGGVPDRPQIAENPVTSCTLQPLSVAAVAALVADTLLISVEQAQPLAQLLVEKTSGNAFFVHQLLDAWYRSSLIWYDAGSKAWEWDLDGAARIDCTDNVADYLGSRVLALPQAVRVWLGQAACFGLKFLMEDGVSVMDLPAETAQAYMALCLEYGLIEPVHPTPHPNRERRPVFAAESGGTGLVLQFGHARIRDSAYQLLDPTVKARTHRDIARLYEKHWSPEQKAQRVFELADHYNAAGHTLSDRVSRHRVAEINLVAGRAANRAALFDEATRYFSAGVAFLDESDWHGRYGLTSQLHIEAMKHEFLCNHYDNTLALAEVVLAHAETPIDALEAHTCKLNVFTMRYQYASMMEVAHAAAALYGITWPQRITRSLVLEEYRTVDRLMQSSDGQLLARRADQALQLVLRIIQVTSNAVTSQPNRLSYLWLKVAGLSILHGFCPDSAIGFLGPVHLRQFRRKQDILDAYHWGEFAKEVVEHFRDAGRGQYLRAKMNVAVTFATTLNHWQHHLASTADALDEYFEGITSIGAESFAVLHAGSKMLVHFCCGTELKSLGRELDLQRQIAESFDLPFPVQTCRMVEQVTRELSEPREAPLGDWPPAERLLGFASDVQLTDDFLQCVRAYLLGHPEDALAAAEDGYQLFKSSLDCTTFLLPEHAFYYGLILAATPETGPRQSRRLSEIVRLFQTWAELSPSNYEHKHWLLRAEVARRAGLWHQAFDLYDKAIHTAKRDGYLQNEAIANECAAKMFLARNQPKVAQIYLQEARFLFSRWGAHHKVQQLDTAYPQWLGPGIQSIPSHPAPASATSVKEAEHGHLDLATILKASQAISSEIRLDHLLPTLLTFAMESAGADRGHWILDSDGDWVVAVSAATDGTHPDDRVPVRTSDLVPSGVIQYVGRTGETVVLHNASRDGRFIREPYIRKHGAKSIFCLPVLMQGGVGAILYLENRLATHVFTPDRVGLLTLLSGQMRIAMENAMMYESMDRLVMERTRELKRVQQQMIESDKMASLGQLTAGVAHEMNNPINFVVASTEPLRRDIEDLIRLLNRYRETVQQQGLDEAFREAARAEEAIDVDYTVQEVSQLLDGIAEGGRRTAEIVKGLRAFSRLDEDDLKSASVLEGIDSTLTLLYRSYAQRIRVAREYDAVPDIECYPGKLNQVFMNLLSNAIQAIPDEGEIRIAVRHVDPSIEIRITDTGVGMSDEVRRRIFEPFFTTKDVGMGTGLGLSISYGIIERHHGRMEVESRVGQGTTVTVTLPVRQTGP